MIRRFIAPLVAALTLSGCILVEDFSPAWNTATPDSCLNKIAQSLYYSEFSRDPEGKDMNTLAHATRIGNANFLMLKQEAADKGGRMYRFGVVNGIFQRYRLNPAMRQAFLADYPDAPVSLRNDTVVLAKLGTEETKLLTEIASKPEYWQIEDQTLYNIMLNPLCRFDDRDLKKLAEDKK